MTTPSAATIAFAEFGAAIGIADLAFDEDGAAALSFDGLPAVQFQYRPDRDTLWLFADLGEPAAGPAIYEVLLKGNFFWTSTRGATLGLSDEEPGHVVLAQAVPWAGLDGPALSRAVETFVDTIRDWREIVGGTAAPADAAGPKPAGDLDGMIRI